MEPGQSQGGIAGMLHDVHTGLKLRLYDPSIEYLDTSFYHEEALYLADDRFVATVVRQNRKNLLDVWPELPWLYPEEIRLAAAIALSVPEGKGMLGFCPLAEQVSLADDPGESLLDPDRLAHVGELQRISQSSGSQAAGPTTCETQSMMVKRINMRSLTIST